MRKPVFGFSTWFDTNWAVQLQKMARGLKFRIEEVEVLYKTKVLISCAVTAQLIRAFVFAYAKIRFSDDKAFITKLYETNKSCFGSWQSMYSFCCAFLEMK